MRSVGGKFREGIRWNFLPFFRVKLYRTDNHEEVIRTPISIGDITFAAESGEFFARIRRGTTKIKLPMDPDLRAYIRDWQKTNEPETLQVEIEAAFPSHPAATEIQFLGNAMKFPEPRTADEIEDDITILCGDFTSAWETAEGFVDGNGLPFTNYSADEFLTALLDFTGTPRGHQRTTIPRLKQSDPFWSARNRLRPDRVDPSRSYDNTARCKALAKNDYLNELYVGVNDEIHILDPSLLTDEYSLLARVKPYEHIDHPADIEPEYNIEYLEWDPTTGFLRGIIGTTGTDLLEPWTHTKFKFDIAPLFIGWRRFTEVLADGGAGGIAVGDTVRVDVSALPGMLGSKNDVRIGYSDGEYMTELPRAISGNFVLFESQENIAAGEELRRTYWIFWDKPDAGAPPVYAPGAVIETYLYDDLLYLAEFGDEHITEGGDRFFLCDKGIAVRSKHLFYYNYPDEDPPGELHNYWWEVASIGTPTVGVKETDIPKPYLEDPREAGLLYDMPRGSYWLTLSNVPVGTPDPFPDVGESVEMRDETGGIYQYLGRVLEVDTDTGHYRIKVENPAKKNYPAYVSPGQLTVIYTYPPGIVPTPNLFVPRHAEIFIEYIKDELSDPPEHTVRVDRRAQKTGTGQQFFPQVVAELSDGQKIRIKPGYYSFSSVPDTEETVVSGTPDRYQNKNEIPCPFKVIFPGVNSTYCLRRGLIVHQRLKTAWKYPRFNELYSVELGGEVVTGLGYSPFAVDGDVFLYDDGETVYIAWNSVNRTKTKGIYYQSSSFGRLIFSLYTVRVIRTYHDRDSTDYTTLPAYEIESFIVEDGKHFGGRRRYKRNWVKTGIRVIWAAPPQNDWKPESWDGDLAFTVLVESDRTDLFEAGDYIRLGGSEMGEPGGKEYVISEIEAVTRFLDSDDEFALEGYTNILKHFTRISCIGVDQPVRSGGLDYPGAYEKQVEGEILGKHLTVAKGWDIRVEMFYWAGGDWTAEYTVSPEYSEPEEGDELDFAEEDAHGEELTVEYDEGWTASPRARLDKVNILPATILPIVVEGLIELEVVDYTDNPADMPDTPGRWQVFIKGKQGTEYNQTYIYFNPALVGKEVKVNYSYYENETELKGFIRENDYIYFNETGRNKWLRIDLTDPTTEPVESYSPRVGDTGLYSLPVLLDGTIYAVLEPSFLIAEFSEEFSGYIDAEIGDDETSLFDILGYLARACGAVAFCSFDDILFYPRTPRENDGIIGDVAKCTTKATLPYKAVELDYRNGRVRVGSNKAKSTEIYSTTCNYIQSKGHAEIIANQLADLFLNTRRFYDITVEKFDTRDEPLDRKLLPAQFIPEDINPGMRDVPIVLTEIKLDKEGRVRYKGYEEGYYAEQYLPGGR